MNSLWTHTQLQGQTLIFSLLATTTTSATNIALYALLPRPTAITIAITSSTESQVSSKMLEKKQKKNIRNSCEKTTKAKK